jgi:hypothetical protein
MTRRIEECKHKMTHPQCPTEFIQKLVNGHDPKTRQDQTSQTPQTSDRLSTMFNQIHSQFNRMFMISMTRPLKQSEPQITHA